jgi:death-on-curing protein
VTERTVRYLTAREVWGINRKVLRAQGGVASLLRDRGTFEGAVARPRTHAWYPGADLIDQAAILIVGLALAHPFVDGNKRTAYTAGDTFLRRNGFAIRADGIEAGEELRQVVDTICDRSKVESQFRDWLRAHVVPLTS